MLPDVPLSTEALRLLKRIEPRILQRLEEVAHTPVSVLLWGPGIDSGNPLAPIRASLRQKLRELGHAALYSEELWDSSSSHSVRVQQLAQAQEFELVISIPCTPGSIGEVHDFAADRRVQGKLLVFLNEEQIVGYSPQSLTVLSGVVGCELQYYPNERDTSVIVESTLDTVQRIRETKYIMSGRI